MAISTVCWEKDRVKLIDQRLLPRKLSYLYCSDAESVHEAIKTLAVRGAPAIGIAAAYGVVAGIKDTKENDRAAFFRKLENTISYLSTARPTAVNLFWALERMERAAEANSERPVGTIKEILLRIALRIHEEDRAACRKIGSNGARLLKKNDCVLTHCNAGALATADFGTALGVIYSAHDQGKNITVYAGETRPLLQGARLTSWELKKHNVDVTLICDSAAGWVMKQGRINAVIVGADRIASNGDSANKVGSYGLAVLAKHHRIPFYVCAPVSTFDFSIKSGEDIPIEERDSSEVTMFSGIPCAPKGVKVYSPAFDIVPAGLISAIVTEAGVIKSPSAGKIRPLEVKNES